MGGVLFISLGLLLPVLATAGTEIFTCGWVHKDNRPLQGYVVYSLDYGDGSHTTLVLKPAFDRKNFQEADLPDEVIKAYGPDFPVLPPVDAEILRFLTAPRTDWSRSHQQFYDHGVTVTRGNWPLRIRRDNLDDVCNSKDSPNQCRFPYPGVGDGLFLNPCIHQLPIRIALPATADPPNCSVIHYPDDIWPVALPKENGPFPWEKSAPSPYLRGWSLEKEQADRAACRSGQAPPVEKRPESVIVPAL